MPHCARLGKALKGQEEEKLVGSCTSSLVKPFVVVVPECGQYD